MKEPVLSVLGEERGDMNRGRIIKVVAVALLISMVFPLTVAAEPPPPGEPSPLSPVVMPNESFEGWAFPPSGWKVIQTNANQIWRQYGIPDLMPYSGFEAAVVLPDSSAQDEVLLTPKIYAPFFYVLLSSMTTSMAACGPVNGVCDLEVWVVRGAWDAGAGNDILLGNLDSAWTASGTWVRRPLSVALESFGIYKPVRIGFRYVSTAGGGSIIALDDVTIIAFSVLNTNLGFERGGTMPKGWKGKNLTAKDKRDNTKFKTGSWSFKMVGSRAKKSLFQTIKLPGYANDSFTLYGCSKSKNAKAGRPYQVVATVYHRDGSKQRHRIKFTPGTHGWECKTKSFVAKEAYKRINLEIRYWKQGGRAWFDVVAIMHP